MMDDRGNLDKIVDTVKPTFEKLAERLGKMLVQSSLMKPLRDQITEDFRVALGEGFRLIGGYANLPRSMFKSDAFHKLANELVDSIFSGIADGIQKTEGEEDPLASLRIELRGMYNAVINGIDCQVALDRDGQHYHMPKCNFAPRPGRRRGKGKDQEVSQDLVSRFDAEVMGRKPKSCCAQWFSYQDERIRFQQPGNLDRALKEVREAGNRQERGKGEKDVHEFLDWLTFEIKPWLDGIERGDHVQLILRMIYKHQAEIVEFNDKGAQTDMDPVENVQEVAKLKEEQWLEMRAWIQGSLPRKEHKVLSLESLRFYGRRLGAWLKERDKDVAKVAEVFDRRADSWLDKLRAERDRVYGKAGLEVPSDSQ
jgi:hypothetical protein